MPAFVHVIALLPMRFRSPSLFWRIRATRLPSAFCGLLMVQVILNMAPLAAELGPLSFILTPADVAPSAAGATTTTTSAAITRSMTNDLNFIFPPP